MIAGATEAIMNGKDVVFDIGGPWPRVKELADASNVKVEIYHFTMTKDEFDSQNPERDTPTLGPGLKIIRIG